MFDIGYNWLIPEKGYIADTDGFVIVNNEGQKSFSIWVDGIEMIRAKEFACLPIPQGKTFTISGGEKVKIWWLKNLGVKNE